MKAPAREIGTAWGAPGETPGPVVTPGAGTAWRAVRHGRDVLRQYAMTLRHLRAVQWYGFVRDRGRRLVASPPFAAGARLRSGVGTAAAPFPHGVSSFHAGTIRLLNTSVSYPHGIRWDDPRQSRLWRYQLQSMPFLLQPDLDPAARGALIDAWIAGNQDTTGEGWEPYPTSCRLVNWLRCWWSAPGAGDDGRRLSSAFAQARHLRRFVEHYVHANHLFENLKALLWAGCAFEGAEAARWRAWAARRLAQQLHEQVLPDGGHYERSAMYHSLVLEGCLDLWNIRAAWDADHPELAPLLRAKAAAMLSWLEAMTHPDGYIALFNDATLDGAPAPAVLFDYARRLGIDWAPPPPLANLAASGYVAVRDGAHYVVVDVGAMGPDHQPGHGHCDLLSFEWSLGGQRVVCDSGVFAYKDAVMRPYVRSTAAHNTVRVDGEEQSEVWADFRVGRRARPRDVRVQAVDGAVHIEGAHSGYQWLPGAPVHRRRFEYGAGTLSIVDVVSGDGEHEIEGFLHFHPAVTVTPARGGFELSVDGRRLGAARFSDWAEGRCERGRYCPGFGRQEPNAVVALRWKGALPFTARVMIALQTESD